MRGTWLGWLALAAAQGAWAAPTAAQQAALMQLFSAGIERAGATAELVRVEQWPKTDAPLVFHVPEGKGWPARLALVAEAPNGTRWYLIARVRWHAKAAVARRALPAGAVLQREDLMLARADVTGLQQWVGDPDAVVGARLLRPVAKGAAIDLRWLRRAPLVRRGEIVTILATIGRIRVQTIGRALRSAQKGEVLWVQNLASGKRIQAVAEAKGLVLATIPGGVR